MQKFHYARMVCSVTLVIIILSVGGCSEPSNLSFAKQHEAAIRMIRASEGRLAPVYAPLADQIVNEYRLARCSGVGIDLGSGQALVRAAYFSGLVI